MLAGIMGGVGALVGQPRVLDPRMYAWDFWAGQFFQDFGLDLPFPGTELYWREWADMVAGSDVGRTQHIPFSWGFGTWQDWAFEVFRGLG